MLSQGLTVLYCVAQRAAPLALAARQRGAGVPPSVSGGYRWGGEGRDVEPLPAAPAPGTRAHAVALRAGNLS
eukprot:7421414-Pyramimonas_sp.AAC.1